MGSVERHLIEKLGLSVEDGRVVQKQASVKKTSETADFVDIGFNRLLDTTTHTTFEKVGGELSEVRSDVHDAAKRFLEKHSSN